MVKWNLVIGALAVTLILTGLVAGRPANAQDTTPPAGASTADTETAAELALYQDFVGKLATNLGQSDPSAVDAAIRTALTQLVDDQLAAGSISANESDALKQSIDASDSPLELFEGHGHKGQESNGDDNGDEGQEGENEQGQGQQAQPNL